MIPICQKQRNIPKEKSDTSYYRYTILTVVKLCMKDRVLIRFSVIYGSLRKS